MRIAMLCPYSLSRPGGVQGQSVGLAAALRERGHHVTVVAPDDRFDVGTVLGPDGAAVGRRRAGDPAADGTVVVAHSVGVRANGSVAPVALSPEVPWRVRRLVAEGGYDMVHLHEPLAPDLAYGCLASCPAPLVATFHRSGDSAIGRWLRPAARWATGRLAVRVAVSEAARQSAEAVAGGHCEVLFNGVDTARFASAVPAPTDGPTILFLGRHEPRKGLGALLEAFCGLAGPARLWIAGDGPQTAALRGAYPPSDRVTWLGVVDDRAVASRLAGADVLCAPSLYGESFGMILLEGFAARCSVVASDIDGYRAAAGGHARLVPPGDVAALAAALDAALAEVAHESGAAAPAARRAAADHAEQWSMRRLATEYVRRYEQLSPGPAATGRVA